MAQIYILPINARCTQEVHHCNREAKKKQQHHRLPPTKIDSQTLASGYQLPNDEPHTICKQQTVTKVASDQQRMLNLLRLADKQTKW
jgi:hypothetical protein